METQPAEGPEQTAANPGNIGPVLQRIEEKVDAILRRFNITVGEEPKPLRAGAILPGGEDEGRETEAAT